MKAQIQLSEKQVFDACVQYADREGLLPWRKPANVSGRIGVGVRSTGGLEELLIEVEDGKPE